MKGDLYRIEVTVGKILTKGRVLIAIYSSGFALVSSIIGALISSFLGKGYFHTQNILLIVLIYALPVILMIVLYIASSVLLIYLRAKPIINKYIEDADAESISNTAQISDDALIEDFANDVRKVTNVEIVFNLIIIAAILVAAVFFALNKLQTASLIGVGVFLFSVVVKIISIPLISFIGKGIGSGVIGYYTNKVLESRNKSKNTTKFDKNYQSNPPNSNRR